jgi:hypothetical protein
MSFKDDVLPIFKGRCIDCHQPGGEGYEKSGLDLRTYAGVMKGTKFGAMVVPGNPDTSNLAWLLDWKASPVTSGVNSAEFQRSEFRGDLATCRGPR